MRRCVTTVATKNSLILFFPPQEYRPLRCYAKISAAKKAVVFPFPQEYMPNCVLVRLRSIDMTYKKLKQDPSTMYQEYDHGDIPLFHEIISRFDPDNARNNKLKDLINEAFEGY